MCIRDRTISFLHIFLIFLIFSSMVWIFSLSFLFLNAFWSSLISVSLLLSSVFGLTIIPVSYTHLDVYKRQIMQCSRLFQMFLDYSTGIRCAGCVQGRTLIFHTVSVTEITQFSMHSPENSLTSKRWKYKLQQLAKFSFWTSDIRVRSGVIVIATCGLVINSGEVSS